MVYLYGASGHSKVVIEICELQNILIGGLIDINPEIRSLLGYQVNNTDRELVNDKVIISIGNNALRKKLAQRLKANFISAIHPSTNISQRTQIGDGTVIMAGVSINSDVEIGKHAIINTNSSVDHDCVIGDYVHISPNAALAGDVTVGEGTHIGIGVCIIQGITIGKWATIGAGAVIIKNVPDYAVVVGNPGKVIKYNQVNES